MKCLHAVPEIPAGGGPGNVGSNEVAFDGVAAVRLEPHAVEEKPIDDQTSHNARASADVETTGEDIAGEASVQLDQQRRKT